MLQGDVSEICRSNQYTYHLTYNFTAFSDLLGSVKFAKFFSQIISFSLVIERRKFKIQMGIT